MSHQAISGLVRQRTLSDHCGLPKPLLACVVGVGVQGNLVGVEVQGYLAKVVVQGFLAGVWVQGYLVGVGVQAYVGDSGRVN